MINVTGDLWTYPSDYRIITTNGTVKKNGSAVLGRGCAKQATLRYPELASVVGTLLKHGGNHVYYLNGYKLFTFPVKHDWFDRASYDLISQSVKELLRFLASSDFCDKTFLLPRPGCGNGQLRYEAVEPLLRTLPDNVRIITNEGVA